jgi:dihydropteroate synthase
MPSALQCGRFELSLDRPLVMGILNLTPDSFSDGGRWQTPVAAIDQAMKLIDEGADILDLGAESTRPGAAPVTAEHELQRLAPVLKALADAPVPVSVDTRKPEVMQAVLDLGADMINDVEGFATPAAIEAVRGFSAACCVMHMKGDPRTMQADPVYHDVVLDVRNCLAERVSALQTAGVSRSRIVVDPGIGFGKTLAHNLALVARLRELAVDDCPVLIGLSRKSMLGALTGRGVDDRLAGSLAGMLAAVAAGARIVRVHDVAATRDALVVWSAVQSARSPVHSTPTL